jgi:CubicO group peptidase (beta-lactamase class C family)
VVARAGVPLLARGYGFADREAQTPNAAETVFRIGSITKTFTAALIMTLQEQGKVRDEDPICKYVDPCPAAWRPVTIRHLLNHSSGIPSYTSLPAHAAHKHETRTPSGVVETFRHLPLEFAPGQQFKYSNSGYFLLGMVVEKASKRKYEDALEREILRPLGLKNTGYDRPGKSVANRAWGYVIDGAGAKKASDTNMSWPFAAGALYSTVGDLLKWSQAISSGSLLPPSLLKTMWTPGPGPYGYGWEVGKSPKTLGRHTVSHSGGIDGFASDLVHYPAEGVTIVILSNLEGAPISNLVHDVSAITFGEPFVAPAATTTASVNPSIYDDYAGSYALGPQMMVKVARKSDNLVFEAFGQPEELLIPEGGDQFYSRSADGRVKFVRGPDGKVIELIMTQGSRSMRAQRTASPNM